MKFLSSTVLSIFMAHSLILHPCFAQVATTSSPSGGRVLWLRADQNVETDFASLTSSWGDLSGSGNGLSSTNGSQAPLLERIGIDGTPSIHFDGNDFLSRPSGMPLGSYTKIAVLTLDDYGSNNNVLSGSAYHALFYGFSDRAQLFHGGSFVVSSISTPLHEATILIATFDASNGIGTLYQNGQLAGSGIASQNNDVSLEVGSYASANFLLGHVSELMIYDRVITQVERQRLEQRLSREYQSDRFPEVSLTLPSHGRLYPRDLQTQEAMASVSGTVTTPGYDSVNVEVRRNDAPWATFAQELLYDASGVAPFHIDIPLLAGHWDYDLDVFLMRRGNRTLIAHSMNLTCGDAYLINGQSNAVAGDYWGEGLGNTSQGPDVRSFGSSTLGADVIQDRHWALSDAEAFYQHGAVGSWGQVLADSLSQSEGVPIALINGAVGGTSITLHQRNDSNPEDPNTIYGRLLYRARASELAANARAMLWYQGESDGEQTQLWSDEFQRLYSSWEIDYPALEQIYVFQIRKGCGVTFSGVREIQRRLPETYANVSVMSTTGAPSHDGCHYFYVGYQELGTRLSRLLRRDLYGSTDPALQDNIEAPQILTAEFTGAMNDEVRLTFSPTGDSLIWQAGSESYFILSDGTSVQSGVAIGNTLLLTLSGASTAQTLSYDGHASDGPWITNARGVGLLTFFDVVIDP